MANNAAAKTEGNGIGMYITRDAITIVEAVVQHGRPRVITTGSAPTPEGCVENGTIFEPTRVAQSIRLLMRQMNVSASSACVSLAPEAFSMRSFRFPEAPAAERRSLVRGELDQAGMLAPVRDEFDFLWMNAPEEQGRKQADACVYYSDAATVETIRDTLRLANLDLVRLEPASIALLRAYTAANPAPVAVLCPFKKHSDLAIFDGVQVRSVRRIPTGSDDILADDATNPSASQGRRSLDGEHVDAAGDRAQGLPDGAVEGCGENRETSHISFLAGEVARSLAFYSREFPDVMRQQKLVVLGEDPVAARLCSLLQGSLPVPAVHESPLFEHGSPATDMAETGSRYNTLIAIGASIGGGVTSVPALNLAQISSASLIGRKAPAALMAGMSASTIWMAAAIIAFGVLTFLNSEKLKESADIQNAIASIQAVRAPMLLKQQIWSAVQSQWSKSQVPAASVLGRAAVSSTTGVALTSLKVSSDGKITLDGKATNADGMQRFADALGKGKSITSPVFEAMRQDSKDGLTFRIVGVSRTAPPTATHSDTNQ